MAILFKVKLHLHYLIEYQCFSAKIAFFQTSGPFLPEPSYLGVEMVRFGKGQVILQGGGYGIFNIYSMTCSNRNCLISLLQTALLNTGLETYYMTPNHFVAIPIPDKMSGCLAEGKNDFKIVVKSSLYTNLSEFNQFLWVFFLYTQNP